jgi:LysM repeat protein
MESAVFYNLATFIESSWSSLELRSRLIVRLMILVFCLAAFSADAFAQHRRGRAATSSGLKVVKVKTGDTLALIAERYHVSIDDLAKQNNVRPGADLRKGQRLIIPNGTVPSSTPIRSGEVIGNRIVFVDGTTFDVQEAWKLGDITWYRKGNVTQSLTKPVKSLEPILATQPKNAVNNESAIDVAHKPTKIETWIYLVGGARLKVDDVEETTNGTWYTRGNLAVFLEKDRIARISKEDSSSIPTMNYQEWSSGNERIDELIRANGTRYGVDPYFIFCVIEQESHFRPRAVSPKGARGLMQLMPGTARRFGVNRPFDPAENIRGGTRYLKELLTMFSGRVDLALAAYNAGEGRVLDYGNRVPPFRETQEYVKRISKRYRMKPPTDLGAKN